jgi:hypothetical protein
MELSDDKVVEIIMDTHTKVAVIADKIDDCDGRIRVLEDGAGVSPKSKIEQAKGIGKIIAFVSAGGYIIIDLLQNFRSG